MKRNVRVSEPHLGPHTFQGPCQDIAVKVRELLGCEYAILYFPEAAYDRSGIELFEREVIPALS